MTIPLATTTVTVKSNTETEPGTGATVATRASAVRAVLSSPSGSDIADRAERVDMVLLCDPVTGMVHTDSVTDNTTATVYRVSWVERRRALGLDHMKAGLVRTSGGVSA